MGSGVFYLVNGSCTLPPGGGWDNIGTGGGETGMRCPSLRWAAGQGPVLVGTIGSLWPSWDAGEGQGCWAIWMLRRRVTPGEGATKASPGGSGHW